MPYNLHTIIHITVVHAGMVWGAAVIAYTLETMRHITTAPTHMGLR